MSTRCARAIVNEETARRVPGPTNLDELTTLWTRIVEQDADLAALLQKMTGTSQLIIEIVITGPDDRVLSASLPSQKGQKIEPPPVMTISMISCDVPAAQRTALSQPVTRRPRRRRVG